MQEARLPFQAVVPDFGHAGTNLPPPPSRVARTPSRVARTPRAGWPTGHTRGPQLLPLSPLSDMVVKERTN